MSVGTRFYPHGLRKLVGRDTEEHERGASPLELFYDLTFVSALGVAGSQLAHGISTGHPGPAVLGFVIALLAIVWAWTGYSWFASAFDNDDWLFRVLTLAQMAGVVVLAIGIPSMFASIEHGEDFTGEIMVAGYVLIRLATIALWTRVAVNDPARRHLAVTTITTVGLAQAGWVAFVLLPLPLSVSLWLMVIFWAFDLGGPIIAELRQRRLGHGGTPWHPHHIAERYGLFAIIAIGETILGTLAAAQDISTKEGWTLDAIAVIGTGIVISFALWWSYFLIPSAPVLASNREKVFPWAYGHILLFASIAATGAGLHVLGYVFDEEHPLQVAAAITAISIPVLIFMGTAYLIHAWLVSAFLRNPVYLIALTAPVAAMILASAGWPLWAALLVVLASPVSVIVGYETGEWRIMANELDHTVTGAHGNTPA